MERRERLFSLDVLRGLDMILLVVIGPLIMAADNAWHFSPAFMAQFHHGWEGFTLWDIIMPLFIFMCGAAVPLALTRRLKEGVGVFWRHVLGRVVLLWFLGLLVQGDLVSLNPRTFMPFSNTLQSIAVGYLAAAAVMCVPSRLFGVVVTVLLPIVYSACLAFGGDYTVSGNFAFKVDQWLYRIIFPADHEQLVHPYQYTWYLTSLMFAFMTLCGYQATLVLQTALTKRQKALSLFAYAAALLLVGFAVSPWIPVIKPIFTLSFTALAMGWCVLGLAILYVVNDVLLMRRGWGFVLFFGQCALTAYFVSHFFAPVLRSFSTLVLKGVLPHLGEECRPLAIRVVSIMGVICVMYVWREFKGSKGSRK